MQNEIEKVQSKNRDCENQLNRCEEVLQELTEKLAEKQKEVGIMLILATLVLATSFPCHFCPWHLSFKKRCSNFQTLEFL